MSLYLGVDIGTSSAKCLAVDGDARGVALAQRAYPMSHPREGWAEQDAEDYWNALVEVVGRCLEECAAKGCRGSDVEALAMSTQGDTLILTDAAGRPLAPALSWMDTRAEEECRELLARADQSFWYRETGLRLTAFSSACKIQWLRKNRPDLIKRGARFCWVPDFLAKRLCGRFATDVPSASWTPAFSPLTRDWSAEVLDVMDMPRETLPEALESGCPMGRLLPQAAHSLGLSEQVTLVAGAFDQAAAAHGAGAVADERCVLSCGTAWVLYLVSSNPAVDDLGRLPICCHVDESEWGYVLPFPGGAGYDWLNHILGAGQDETTGEAEPPVFIPHLYGGVCPDWRSDSRGSLLGLTMAHTGADVRLALMRGIASEARRNVEAAEALGARIGSVRMAGGAGKSSIWPQLIADVLNRPMEVCDLVESACYGAAKLAAGNAAAGWTAAESVRTLEPQPTEVEYENRQYARYLRFYETLLPTYEAEASS